MTSCAAVALTAAGVVAVASTGPGAPAGAASADPFSRPRANAYFPLEPGTVLRYAGRDDGERFRERVEVTSRHKLIQGVRTTVVRDVLRRADGTLAEKTHDWYAADDRGAVWYFGERTATYDRHGQLVSREGSWQAGVDGAVRGVVMPADPAATDAFRQELYRDHAEDQAWIVQRNASVTVPHRVLHHALRTFEWTRLEPRVVSEKLYGRGIGIVRERDVAGGHEQFRLLSVTRR